MYKSFPLFIILILFISSFTMPLIKRKKIVKAISFISMLVSLILSSVLAYNTIKFGKFAYRAGHYDAPFGIEFLIGNVEVIMGVLFTFVATMVVWYSIFRVEEDIKEHRIPLYYLLVNILIGGLLALVYTNDIFNAYVFIEISALASCGIIVVKDKKENIKATLKYLIMSSLGSGLVLVGIAFLYSMTGHLSMPFMHEALVKNAAQYPNAILISVGLFTVGLGVKSAMFPLHIWLPDAHASAPASSSALLSALVVKAYALLYIKLIYRVFGLEIVANYPVFNIVLTLGSLGMIMGSIFAILQKQLKRLIAYSSVAQIGYIFFGIGLGTELGLAMAIFHIIAHALVKSTLFLCAGEFIETTGHKNISDLKGIGKTMPLVLGIFFVGSLSMIGIPILPGFVSKWYLAIASIESGKLFVIAVILASSLLNAVYYFPIVINGFFGEETVPYEPGYPLHNPKGQLVPIVILILAAIMAGLASKTIIMFIQNGLA